VVLYIFLYLCTGNCITVVIGVISCTFGLGVPTYFEMFALGATLFSVLIDQKKERRPKMKNDTWKATAVATVGDAWKIQIAVKDLDEIMISTIA